MGMFRALSHLLQDFHDKSVTHGLKAIFTCFINNTVVIILVFAESLINQGKAIT